MRAIRAHQAAGVAATTTIGGRENHCVETSGEVANTIPTVPPSSGPALQRATLVPPRGGAGEAPDSQAGRVRSVGELRLDVTSQRAGIGDQKGLESGGVGIRAMGAFSAPMDSREASTGHQPVHRLDSAASMGDIHRYPKA